jgi:hypothetical protein
MELTKLEQTGSLCNQQRFTQRPAGLTKT